MSLIASPSFERTPWRALLAAAAIALMLPAGLGFVLLALGWVLRQALLPEWGLSLSFAGMVLAASPFLAVAGMVLAVPVCSFLLRLGWFGWLPVAGTGLTIGLSMQAMTDIVIAAPFGLLSLLVLRTAFSIIAPRISAPSER